MDETKAQAVADGFKVFGDKTRIRILFCLQDSEKCVEEISESVGMEQSAVSHQLRILKDARLIGVRKEGRYSYYFLKDEHVSTILKMGLEHAAEV